jgi:hypothetical protein
MAIRALDVPASTDLILNGPTWSGVGVVDDIPYLRTGAGLKTIALSAPDLSGNGHVAFGNTAVVDQYTVLPALRYQQVVNVNQLFSETAGPSPITALSMVGIQSDVTSTIIGEAAGGVSLKAISGIATNLNSVGAEAIDHLTGVSGLAYHNAAGAPVNNVYGLYGESYVYPGSTVTAGQHLLEGYSTDDHNEWYLRANIGFIGGVGVPEMSGVWIAEMDNYGPNVLALAAGLRVGSITDSGAGSITNVYGLKIEDQTAGVTNYAIHTGLGQVRLGGPLTLPGGTLLTTSAALTNGAAAAAGTLANAPAAGNPTKWIPINDNGTTRYIPAW